MGLPEILIEFKTKAQTAVTRSQNGIVAVILEDSTKVGDENLSYTYNYEADIVKSDWTTTNLDYLNKISRQTETSACGKSGNRRGLQKVI